MIPLPLGRIRGVSGLLFAILIVFSFTVGIQTGASADSLENATVNGTKLTQNVTANITNDTNYNHPHIPDKIERPNREPHPAVGDIVQRGMRNMVTTLLTYVIGAANFGAELGYANRSWVSPAWVGYLSQSVLFTSMAGYILMLFRRVLREGSG